MPRTKESVRGEGERVGREERKNSQRRNRRSGAVRVSVVRKATEEGVFKRKRSKNRARSEEEDETKGKYEEFYSRNVVTSLFPQMYFR